MSTLVMDMLDARRATLMTRTELMAVMRDEGEEDSGFDVALEAICDEMCFLHDLYVRMYVAMIKRDFESSDPVVSGR